MAPEQLAGLVLAGGRGSRLGGADKGWLLYRDKPLVVHALEQLQGCGQTSSQVCCFVVGQLQIDPIDVAGCRQQSLNNIDVTDQKVFGSGRIVGSVGSCERERYWQSIEYGGQRLLQCQLQSTGGVLADQYARRDCRGEQAGIAGDSGAGSIEIDLREYIDALHGEQLVG